MTARAAAVPKIRGMAEAKRTSVRELPASCEDSAPQLTAASTRFDGRQPSETVMPSMMLFTVRMAHISPHMVQVPSVVGGALSK